MPWIDSPKYLWPFQHYLAREDWDKAEAAVERWQQSFPIAVKVFYLQISQKHRKASLATPQGLGRNLEKGSSASGGKNKCQHNDSVVTFVVSAMVQDWVILVLKEKNFHANPLSGQKDLISHGSILCEKHWNGLKIDINFLVRQESIKSPNFLRLVGNANCFLG